MTCSPIPGTTSASMLLPPELSASLCKGTTLALSLPFQRNGHQLLSIFPAGHPGGEVTGAQATRTCSLLLCSALLCLCQNPLRAATFTFCLVAGHHPALCLSPASRILAPGRHRKSRTWRMTSAPVVSNHFHYCSHSQIMICSFSFTNIDLACITPTAETTLPFMFLGTGK